MGVVGASVAMSEGAGGTGGPTMKASAGGARLELADADAAPSAGALAEAVPLELAVSGGAPVALACAAEARRAA